MTFPPLHQSNLWCCADIVVTLIVVFLPPELAGLIDARRLCTGGMACGGGNFSKTMPKTMPRIGCTVVRLMEQVQKSHIWYYPHSIFFFGMNFVEHFEPLCNNKQASPLFACQAVNLVSHFVSFAGSATHHTHIQTHTPTHTQLQLHITRTYNSTGISLECQSTRSCLVLVIVIIISNISHFFFYFSHSFNTSA